MLVYSGQRLDVADRPGVGATTDDQRKFPARGFIADHAMLRSSEVLLILLGSSPTWKDVRTHTLPLVDATRTRSTMKTPARPADLVRACSDQVS